MTSGSNQLVRRFGRECLRCCLLAPQLGDASPETLDVRFVARRRAGRRPRWMSLKGHCGCNEAPITRLGSLRDSFSCESPVGPGPSGRRSNRVTQGRRGEVGGCDAGPPVVRGPRHRSASKRDVLLGRCTGRLGHGPAPAPTGSPRSAVRCARRSSATAGIPTGRLTHAASRADHCDYIHGGMDA